MLNFVDPIHSDTNKASEDLEALHCLNGPACSRCGETDRMTRGSGRRTRRGIVIRNSRRKPFINLLTFPRFVIAYAFIVVPAHGAERDVFAGQDERTRQAVSRSSNAVQGQYAKCIQGDAPQCDSLGTAFVNAKDFASANWLYSVSCDLNDASGCLGLGLSYSLGRGVSVDHSHAYNLMEKACRLNHQGACAIAPGERAQTASAPLGPATRLAARPSQKSFKQSWGECDRYILQSCYEAAFAVEHTPSMHSSYKDMMVTMYEMACDGRIATACLRLGAMYVAGNVLPQSESDAEYQFKNACAAGSSYGCAEAKKHSVKFIPRDRVCHQVNRTEGDGINRSFLVCN